VQASIGGYFGIDKQHAFGNFLDLAQELVDGANHLNAADFERGLRSDDWLIFFVFVLVTYLNQHGRYANRLRL
jgi:hypothetical protein